MTDASAPHRILVVCLGNYCRSPFAAVVLTRQGGQDLEVHSAGLVDKWVGGTAHPEMIAAAESCGYDLTAHVPVQVNRAALDRADLVLAMDQSVLDKLLLVCGDKNTPKIRLYLDGQDVPDPMDGPEDAFTACARIIEVGAARYLP
ncbi:low molecular weight protein-tyrosine-phosphatase [Streptomyces sp. BH055]|uniref:low molecular weight protein-tyrosine-phosphatase n=1 Tax=Streptomyces sp. BH055 TaxID=3401173 RepID=UPI003BB5B038